MASAVRAQLPAAGSAPPQLIFSGAVSPTALEEMAMAIPMSSSAHRNLRNCFISSLFYTLPAVSLPEASCSVWLV